MKRFTLLTLIAAILCMLLTGCAGTNSANGYRGNVSTTDNGRVNGTNDGMTGTFTGEEGFTGTMDDLEDGMERGLERGKRTWHDGNQRSSNNDSANGSDTNTGNPHNAVGEGLYSGRGNRGNNGNTGSNTDNANGNGQAQDGRPTPRSGSRPAAQ